MKNLFKTLKRQDGFTLVELMVVVAIIGLLSAVAVPNFKKYQAKAKISEAKLQLSALYTAEASFFSDYNMYSSCLNYMGFDPAPEYLNRYYAVGFSAPAVATADNAHDAAVNSGLNSIGCPKTNAIATASTASVNSTNLYFAGKGIGSVIASSAAYLPASTLGTQSTETTMIYTAGAGGVIAAGFITTGANSQLTIDEKKVLRNIINGY